VSEANQQHRVVVPDAGLKLRAFLEGLEVQHIDKLLALGQVGDFRRLGEVMAERTKELKHNKDVCGERSESVERSG
jgi:hypothetical protein